MNRQSNAARRTLDDLTARHTLHEVSESSAIEQEDDLLITLQTLSDSFVQRFRPRQRAALFHTLGGSHIDEYDFR